ncbi:MAG: PSD1 and planctomycete cytochrome C domain-containing protein [Verrucomicrobiota bacterium]|nr:PSD1 and planctomycete cytochrome C domain-containing protein [Verrucomicrobiota bacterium]
MMKFRLLLIALVLSSSPIAAEPQVNFNRDIRPILANRCFQCHGPDEKERKSELRLDTREGALADLGGYAAIVAGNAAGSELLERITAKDPEELMPPAKSKKPRLTESEVMLFRQWINQGAEYQGHWAFAPLGKQQPPENEHPVDHFIRKKLANESISPAPPADRYTLIRRLYLDLIGLLPTPGEITAFINDRSDAAYEKLVDSLLANPHYGERWGRHWLDQARYADSHGYSIDSERQMWPYRDWVINALNEDMPFDRFTIEQLAGDLLPEPTKSQIAATAFHRNTLINQEGGSDPEQFRVEATIDRVNTTGAVWLGLTIGCAQCHTHKFDPITQREYYQMFAFFNNAEDRNNTGPTISIGENELIKVPEVRPATLAKTGIPEWIPANYTRHRASSGAQLIRLDDNSLLADKTAAPNDVYEVTATTQLPEISALRLRVLPHESLPKNGPGRAANGNFVLSDIRLLIDGREQKIIDAVASHSKTSYPVKHAIDKNPQSGWALNVDPGLGGKNNAPHEAVFTLEKTAAALGRKIEIRLSHDRNLNYLIGRFALDFSSKAPAKEASVPPKSKAKPVNLMVMRDLKSPRDTFLLTRGNFTRPDREKGKIPAGSISAIAPPLKKSGKAGNRLDLARWLVNPANPLTPRVTVNRVWMRYFGRGLVETEEDFGTRGALPSHPGLLDYLARRFINEGWSMKKLHRLIVTSATYRQSSAIRKDLAEKDPNNLLLARQSRTRLDAEIIRDAALSASGLLEPRIGGPGIRPPQPPGIYSFTQSRKRWPTSKGSDRYRRAMYIVFFRSSPYPLFGTFDAPDFQTTCTSRGRSNTPLQALAIANDVAFMELAKGLAMRVINEVPGEAAAQRKARIKRAVMLALGRPPGIKELEILSNYAEKAVKDFQQDPTSAKALLKESFQTHDTSLPEAASLVSIARTIFNTDNFITRE